MAAGAILGMLIHPDWDHAEVKGVVADLGPFKLLVKPYGKAIPHRSFLSHGPLIGTAGRLAYILFPFWLLFRFFHSRGYLSLNWIEWLFNSEFFWWMAFGLIVVDSLHTLMDLVTTGFKRFIGQLLRGA
jgi:uncharacterized metal-binding protein